MLVIVYTYKKVNSSIVITEVVENMDQFKRCLSITEKDPKLDYWKIFYVQGVYDLSLLLSIPLFLSMIQIYVSTSKLSNDHVVVLNL